MKSSAEAKSPKKMMLAVFLGTALATLGPASTQAAEGITTDSLYNISRYCTACWRNARLPIDRWADCTQEVFSRLLQRLPATGWERVLEREGLERQEFLRAIDTVKKRVQRERSLHPLENQPVTDRQDGERRNAQEDREIVQLAARQALSRRQQQILQLSLEGHSIAEIAEELGIGADRVSDEKYKAIRKLRSWLQDRDLESVA